VPGLRAAVPSLALAPIFLSFAQGVPALSVQSNCGSDVKCRCTNANGNDFAQCIDCVVGTDPDSLAQSAGQGVLSDFASDCANNDLPISSLTLSFATPTASTIVRTSASLMSSPPGSMSGFVAGLRFAFLVLITQALAAAL
ncbi:hypothetical protein B0H12DRAFT_1127491, partial [Mycena haematopus]